MPSSLSLALAVEVDGVTVPLMMQLRPLARTLLPRRSGGALCVPADRARGGVEQLPEVGILDRLAGHDRLAVDEQVAHPELEGIQPSRSAIMSIWVSYAQAAWLMP